MAKKQKSKAGRKPIGDKPLVSLTIRVDAAQQQQWKQAAKASGLSLSKWIRDTLNNAIC